MTQSITTLLKRNLDDVFGEADPARRRAAVDDLYHEDAVFYDPHRGVHRGREAIDHIAGVIQASHPDFVFTELAPPEECGDGGRVRWLSGAPGQPPVVAGTDVIIVRDGRIATLYLFFDPLPQ